MNQTTKQLFTVEIEAPIKNREQLFDFIQQKFSESEDSLFYVDEIGRSFEGISSSDSQHNEFYSFRFMTTNKEKWINYVNHNEYKGSGRHWSGNGVRVSKLSAYSLKNLINASIMIDEEIIN